MWLNHSKYNGFGEFSLFQKSQILGDFGVDLGPFWALWGSLLVLWGSFWGHLGVRMSMQKKHVKKVLWVAPTKPG